ncbi:MAG: hypothetical protein JXX28_16630 [Deltaproteobacteria bacterium]|nr:hypothetical protein [Deltaproteobacteria bacterium]
MVLITAVSLGVVSHLGARSTTLAVSHTVVEQVAALTEARTHAYLDSPRRAASLVAHQLAQGAVEQGGGLEALLYYTLVAHDELAMVSYGDERGAFTMVKRLADGSLGTKQIRVTEAGREVRWRYRAPGAEVGDILREEVVADDPYDPRARPWYAAGREAFAWTDVYLFYTDKAPGITAATPVVREGQFSGVVSVDLGLRQFSEFLAGLEVGQRGLAVILDGAGHIVGSPDPGDMVREQEDGTLVLRLAGESTVPAVAALAPLLAADPAARTARIERYSSGGEEFLASLLPIDIEPDRRWLIAVVVPEDDFLGQVKSMNRRNGMLGGTLVLLTLLASLALSRHISRALQTLVVEADRMRSLRFDQAVDARSSFREVYQVLDALEGMRTGLRAFERYMPVELVRLLLERHEEPRLQSELRRVTVYFSDIAGFTTVSEQVGPTEMATRLGDYLGTQTHVIQDEKGTVVQYVGDQIMAFWNAPLDVPDHARRACAAALDCQQVVAHLWEDEQEAPSFPTRVGIHTCEVAVGHFGSPDRLYYGAVGDGVNLASRLEGANKFYGTWILVSEDTRTELDGEFEFRWLDRVVVKGRVKPTALFELLGRKGSVAADTLAARDRYEEGLRCYFDRDWDGAESALRQAAALRGDDQAAALFLERCAMARVSPPPAGWDRAHHMEKK